MKDYLLVLLMGYFIGQIQFAYIIGRLWKKQDIRKLGSGNSGASNFVQHLGVKTGILIGLLDILKAFISILIMKKIFPAFGNDYTAIYLNGFGVIMGHNFPLFMKFKGGKGTASSLGMIFGINPLYGLASFFIVLAITLITNYIAIGAMALPIILLVLALVNNYGMVPIIISLILLAIGLSLHIKNFKRIKNHEEKGLRQTSFRKKD